MYNIKQKTLPSHTQQEYKFVIHALLGHIMLPLLSHNIHFNIFCTFTLPIFLCSLFSVFIIRYVQRCVLYTHLYLTIEKLTCAEWS